MKRRVLWLLVCVAMVASLLVMPVSAMASSKARMMKTNVKVNLRDPNDYQHITSVLKKGTTVYFTGKTYKSFYLVQTSSGKTGYVFKMYLDDMGSVTKSSVYKVSTATKLRKSASSSSRSVCSLDVGRYVQVYSVQNGWAYVQTTKGKKGYVLTSCLSK